MKKLFESDSNARTRGVGCVAELVHKLEETFEDCDEQFVFDYNWANWNLEDWLSKMSPFDATPFLGKMARFSFDNVFR